MVTNHEHSRTKGDTTWSPKTMGQLSWQFGEKGDGNYPGSRKTKRASNELLRKLLRIGGRLHVAKS